MIGLLITQCLLSDITHCRSIKEPMLEATTIERCQDLAPMAVDRISKPYDIWFVRTWECVSMDYNPKKEKNL
jgi:hypothetical protein